VDSFHGVEPMKPQPLKDTPFDGIFWEYEEWEYGEGDEIRIKFIDPEHKIYRHIVVLGGFRVEDETGKTVMQVP